MVEALTTEAEDARSARLRYVDDTMPGFGRERRGSTFVYVDQHGEEIEDEAQLSRIRALAIPPAYEHVWICPIPNGHVQATARDARGRKQYRYHKRWSEVRDANKFESTIAFARALPALRTRVANDLAKGGTSRDTVLASVIAMLEATLVRVGNETYARENGSYGLTTLRSRHVRIEGEKRIRLRFRGKSGIEHAVTIEDRRLARTIRRCRDLEGESLFRYVDDAGETHEVDSDDVNAYIREATAADFSAKDFRTWNATVICAVALEGSDPAETVADAKRNVGAALAATAARLGNTPAVCRKSYVHPSVIEAYLDERRIALPKASSRSKATGLDADERRVLAFLERARNVDARGRNLGLLKASVRQAKRRRTAA